MDRNSLNEMNKALALICICSLAAVGCGRKATTADRIRIYGEKTREAEEHAERRDGLRALAAHSDKFSEVRPLLKEAWLENDLAEKARQEASAAGNN